MKLEPRKYDVLGVGNSIVDVLSFVDEKFLYSREIGKGIMTLIDEDMAETLYAATGQTTEVSGGSAANTVAGIASMGGKSAFIGRVKDDELGKIFTHDLNGVGVKFPSKPATDGKATARCFIFVTPDAERTMMTYLGACTQFNEAYVDEDLIKNSKIVYIEGYLWDEPNAIAAIRKTLELAKKHGTKTSFTLSDPFCVGRHRDAFLELLPEIDILLCNEDEAKSLFETDDLEVAINKIGEKCPIASITCSAKGSVVIYNNTVLHVATKPVNKLVDTTGAGDLYAAGFLYGLANEKEFQECANLGNMAAAAIIQQLGARPLKPLKSLVA